MALALTVSVRAQHQFEALHSLPAGWGVSAFGDVDGDGDLDIVVATYGQNRLLLNDGLGTFTDATAGRMPVHSDYTAAVALGDVDGDGDLDIVFGNNGGPYYPTWSGEQNRLYLNDGTGHFTDTTAVRLPLDSDPTAAVVLGDIDGDGDLDLACGNNVIQDGENEGEWGPWSYQWGWMQTYGQPNKLYLNDGTGHFTDATARMPWDNDPTTAAAMVDMDGDGDVDIVFANGRTMRRQWSGTVGSIAVSDWSHTAPSRLYRNDGTGSFTEVPLTNDPSARAVAFGDVDGDGDPDLLVGHDHGYSSSQSAVTSFPAFTFLPPAGQQDRLYLNNGGGVFQDVTTTHLPIDADVTRAVAFADVDGDGDLDIVCGSGYPNPQTRLYLNDGTGIFTDATAARMPPGGAISVAFGDVDSDGDLDLVGGDGQLWLYSNLLRQLDATQAPQVGQPYSLDAFARCGTQAVFDVAVVFLSTTRVSMPIAPFGLLGIDPMAILPTVVIPQPAGVGSIAWNLPNVPNAVGTAIYSQALVVSWPFGARFTNVVAGVVQ